MIFLDSNIESLTTVKENNQNVECILMINSRTTKNELNSNKDLSNLLQTHQIMAYDKFQAIDWKSHGKQLFMIFIYL